jgi:hypothetical protein
MLAVRNSAPPRENKMKKKSSALAFALAILIASLASAHSGGAGGPFVGATMPEWNPDFMPDASGVRLLRIGAGGYGVSSDGAIIGGFGMAMIDAGLLDATLDELYGAQKTYYAGGVGGLVSGRRLGSGSFAHLDLAARLGAGGFARTRGRVADGGWAVLYAEPYAELGLRFTPWMRLTASVGYMFMVNMAPGSPFKELVLRSPTVALGVAFGGF